MAPWFVFDAIFAGILGAAYLMGSVPFGVIFTRLFHKGDVRAIGSKSIGATNVLRTGSKAAAALTVLCDAGKGFLAVFLYQQLQHSWGPLLVVFPGQPQVDTLSTLIALSAILGHIFPLWLCFKGGKGIATALGTLLALSPWTALVGLAIWGSVFAWKRISSLSAISACLTLPLFTAGLVTLYPTLLPLLAFTLMLTPLLLWTHRGNIRRLFAGQESSFKGGH